MAQAGVPRLLIPLMLHYIRWRIGHRWEDIAPTTTICRIRCPVLLVHGTEDQTVPVADARRIHDACPRRGVELLLMEGVGHSPIDGMDRHGPSIMAFLDRALRPNGPPESGPDTDRPL
jgi:dipeptidyl aminopeptidase/acylaminoacyl peptidase